MANTRHGHHIPGTPEDPSKAKPGACGGLWTCRFCMNEAANYLINNRNEGDKDEEVHESVESLTRQAVVPKVPGMQGPVPPQSPPDLDRKASLPLIDRLSYRKCRTGCDGYHLTWLGKLRRMK